MKVGMYVYFGERVRIHYKRNKLLNLARKTSRACWSCSMLQTCASYQSIGACTCMLVCMQVSACKDIICKHTISAFIRLRRSCCSAACIVTIVCELNKCYLAYGVGACGEQVCVCMYAWMRARECSHAAREKCVQGSCLALRMQRQTWDRITTCANSSMIADMSSTSTEMLSSPCTDAPCRFSLSISLFAFQACQYYALLYINQTVLLESRHRLSTHTK